MKGIKLNQSFSDIYDAGFRPLKFVKTKTLNRRDSCGVLVCFHVKRPRNDLFLSVVYDRFDDWFYGEPVPYVAANETA